MRSSRVRPTSTSSCSRVERSTATSRTSPTGPPCTSTRRRRIRRVSFDDRALAVHFLIALAYVGGIIVFWVLIVSVRRIDTPQETIRMEPIVLVGNAAVGLGAVGTIVVGIFLAFSVDS